MKRRRNFQHLEACVMELLHWAPLYGLTTTWRCTRRAKSLDWGSHSMEPKKTAWVSEIRPDGAADWFNRNFPDRRIEVDDRIVEVDGKPVSDLKPAEIIDLIHSCEVVRMRVARAVQGH
mmetsp:Transcript_15625/g.28387  ORF Transcript_15625/g.28387 Transcript_15625/m.28387 type:complete len:119 (-) Transcript_15625:93-449(-)